MIVLTIKDVVVPENLTGKMRFESGTPQEIVAMLTNEGK